MGPMGPGTMGPGTIGTRDHGTRDRDHAWDQGPIPWDQGPGDHGTRDHGTRDRNHGTRDRNLALRGSNGVEFRVCLLILRQPVDGTRPLSNTVYMQSKSISRSSRLDETGGRVLKHCKLQYEINFVRFRLPFGLFPFWKAGFAFLRTGFAPQIFQDFGRYPSKWFLAITCTIWLRLEFRGLDSAWFFSPHLLFVHAQGQMFGPRIEFWIQGQHSGPGTFLG